MDSEIPGLLAARLDGESVDAMVPLDGDAIAVTPTRTLVYRAEGLLRDESVEAFPHETERVECAVGRRTATLRLVYADGTREFSVPNDRLEDVLEPLVAGVLAAAGVVGADEAVRAVYRFSELTLVVTDRRVVKQVGTALWDAECESYPFEDVTGLDVEEGRVAAELAFVVDGRPQRVKVPADRTPEVYRTVETALLDYHGVESLDALAPDEAGNDAGGVDARSAIADDRRGIGSLLDGEGDAADESDAPSVDDSAGSASTGTDADGVDVGDGDVGDAVVGSADEEGFRFAAPTADPEDRSVELARLTEAVERQNALLERQQETIDRLVDELRRGR